MQLRDQNFSFSLPLGKEKKKRRRKCSYISQQKNKVNLVQLLDDGHKYKTHNWDLCWQISAKKSQKVVNLGQS